MLGYIDQQRGKICPQCEQAGARAKEQVEGSLFALYICPNAHEYEIDKIFECRLSEVAQLRQQIEQECEGLKQQYAVAAPHYIINRRFGNLNRLHVRLEQFVGEQEAVNVVTKAYANAVEGHAD